VRVVLNGGCDKGASFFLQVFLVRFQDSKFGVRTSRSGFTVYSSAMRASNIRPRNSTVSTWIIARMIEMFLVVRRTLKPAATSGVTCSNAALISREYGIPIVRVVAEGLVGKVGPRGSASAMVD
jgi:hypothetical protein